MYHYHPAVPSDCHALVPAGPGSSAGGNVTHPRGAHAGGSHLDRTGTIHSSTGSDSSSTAAATVNSQTTLFAAALLCLGGSVAVECRGVSGTVIIPARNASSLPVLLEGRGIGCLHAAYLAYKPAASPQRYQYISQQQQQQHYSQWLRKPKNVSQPCQQQLQPLIGTVRIRPSLSAVLVEMEPALHIILAVICALWHNTPRADTSMACSTHIQHVSNVRT